MANLIDIAAAGTGERPETMAGAHATYGALKATVTDAVIGLLEPIQKAHADLDPVEVDAVFDDGSVRAAEAAPVLEAAKRAIGL